MSILSFYFQFLLLLPKDNSTVSLCPTTDPPHYCSAPTHFVSSLVNYTYNHMTNGSLKKVDIMGERCTKFVSLYFYGSLSALETKQRPLFRSQTSSISNSTLKSCFITFCQFYLECDSIVSIQRRRCFTPLTFRLYISAYKSDSQFQL